ncbi:glycosyltransferase, partial [Planktothrix agardhii 1033]|nr:glycosyltransferase [Planktothrix agardhii 1033]
RPKVAVCSWELAHNPAGRAYTLAQLYQAIADVEIIGSIFPKYGRELWEPIRKISIPCHSFTVEDEGLFVEQAMNLVLTHPYDIVHLSKPRMPNILFGLLYKMVWDARVIVDIDDEELGFVQAETPIEFEDFLKSQGQLPELKKLTGKEWTQIAVGLVKEFDGVTVSNPALQKRYGGEIIRHARDEKLFEPSSELRSQSREHLGISQDKKVVLFFGTPRKHKGLVATAEALATLGQQDVVFVIVGDFPDPSLKAKLQAIQGVEYLFLGNQPFDQIPDVVAVGDVCVLLQDGESAVSQFQIPAKLSDALGMGLTVLMSESGAVKDIVDSGAVIRVTEQDLGAALSRVLSDGAEAQMLGSNARELFRLNLLLGGLPSVSSVLSGWGEQKVESKALSKVSQGVSVIVLSLNGAALLDRLLSTFFATNTYFPVELIIIDHGSTDNTAEIVAKQAIKGDVRYINRGGNYSFSDSCNCGATQAKYPHLLFLNNDIVFTEDVLPLAVGKLDNSGIGAVGVRLDDDPSLLPNGKEPGVQHTGIEFVWNENRGYFQPEQIRHPSLKDYLVQKSQGDFFTAVTGAFLLCRKMEFEKLGGFSRNYDYGLEDIDFCLRLGRDLQKKCYCINEVSLQHLEGATRKLGNASNNIEKNHQVFKQIWDNHLRDLIVKQKSEPDRKVTLELLKVSIDPQNSASLGEEKHHISLRFKGFIESFDRYNAKGWVANTELVFDRIRLLVEKIDLGAIPISKISSDVEKELESNSSKSRFIAHLGGILQFSSANLRHLKISLIPDMKDIEISKIAPVTAELANFWDESITFNPLLSHEQNSDFPVILQSLSLIDSREILCIFIANKNYTEKEVKIVFVQENDDSLTNDRDIQIIATHQCSLSSEFVPLRIPCKKLVKPLLIVVQDLNDTILFTDCIPYPSLLSHTNQLFTEHLCLLNNIPKNRALSRLSLQILTNQVKLHKINFNSFLPWQEISIILVDLFNTQIPRELGTVTENINLCPLKECNLYQLVNPTPPFNDFQLIAYGQKPDVNQPLKKIEAVSLFKSFITENIKSKYVLLLDKHTILRPDFLSFVIEYCVSEQPDSIYDIFYWNSMVYPIGQTPFLLQRSPFIYPEVALNNGTPVFSLLVSTEFWVEHLEDFLKLYQTQPQLSSLLGMTEPSKVKFIEEYLETVEVPIPHISNQQAKNLPESKITIADKPEIRGFHAIPTQEKSLLLSPNTYKQFTQLKGISIIINFRDKQDLTNLCLESIRIQKFAPKLQIILVNNRSKVEQRQSVLEKAYELFGKAAVKIIDYEFAFNHSEQCNIAAREADYDLLVLMNNDVVLGSEDLFAKLSAYSLLPNVATVGCKLLARKSANSYSIKSAGMFLRPKPTAAFGGGIVGEYLPPDILSNSNYLCLGNTFALAFIPKQVYWSLNGLDGVNFPTDYNDVDFCLRAIQDGLNHIVVNDCIAIDNGRASIADTSEYPASLGLISSMKNFGLLTKPTNFYPFL